MSVERKREPTKGTTRTFLGCNLSSSDPGLLDLLPELMPRVMPRLGEMKDLPRHPVGHPDGVVRADLWAFEGLGEVPKPGTEVEGVVGCLEDGRLEPGELGQSGEGGWVDGHDGGLDE